MPSESVANFPSTSLGASCAQADATISVLSAAGFPSTGQYRIRIDNELLLVTGGQGSLSWVVSRGVEGTPAGAHANGSTVIHVLTAGGLSNLITTLATAVPTTYQVAYLSTTGLSTVFFTALNLDGSTLTARTQAGVAESSVAGLYTYTQNVVGVSRFVARWDEGVSTVYSQELVVIT